MFYNINATLEDIYQKKTKKIAIDLIRNDKNVSISFKIPLYYKEIHFPGEADQLEGCNQQGDIIFTIYDKPHSRFNRINDYDLMMSQKINFIDLYHDFIFEFQHLDEETIKVKCRLESIIEQEHLYQKLPGLGFAKNLDERGDLIIRYIIDFPKFDGDKLDELEKLCQQKNTFADKQNGDQYLMTQNCPYEDVYFID